MSRYRATVDWRLEGDFAARRYSRVHTLSFEAGLTVPGTAGPANINPRYGRADERKEPRSEYLLFEDQPARAMPYTPIDVMPRITSSPILTSAIWKK